MNNPTERMSAEQRAIANETLRNNPRMRFGDMADLLLQLPDFQDFDRDDLLLALARSAWRLESPK